MISVYGCNNGSIPYTIRLNKDSTFIYHHGGSYSNGGVSGTWTKKKKNILLN